MAAMTVEQPHLVITPHLSSILEAVESNLVTQVTAPTGSGKSIGIPKMLGEAGYKVFVSVPTRVSAMSLCNYLGTISTVRVGYAAEGNVCYDHEDRVVYATSGHLRRKVLSYFARGLTKTGLHFTDIFILDETHSGSMDVSALLSLWMVAQQRGLPVPKLMLLSATPTDLPVEPKPVIIDVPVPTPYPVTIIYDPVDEDDKMYDHVFDLAVSKHHDPRIRGDFLIFVPGSREADELTHRLQEELKEDALVLPAYSTLHGDELRLIYTPSSERRKIVVATNIAESSITIDGLVLVIDTMLYKEAVPSASDATRLDVRPITKDSAKQRSGRVGRTCPGECYRIISETAYEDLDDHRVPDIERLPLHNLVMEFLHAGVDPATSIRGICPLRVENSIELLKMLGMLQEKKGRLDVTPCGSFAPTVPLGVRNAAFLWNWIQAKNPIYPGVVIASLIDSHSAGYLHIPRKRRDMGDGEYTEFCHEYINRNFKVWISETPLHTFLNMWLDLCDTMKRNHFRFVVEPSAFRIQRWCRDNSVQYKSIVELTTIISQTYRTVRDSYKRINVNISLFNPIQEMRIAMLILYNMYHDNKMRYFNKMHPKTGHVHFFDRRRPISKIEIDVNIQNGDFDLIPLATHEIITRRQTTIGILDIFIPYYPITDN
jgi:HrpA-like RNA helicase